MSGCIGECSNCPSELICPSNCPFGTHLSSDSCQPCDWSCNYGCRSGETCELCKNKECVTCTSFNGPCTSCVPNTSLSEGTCSCDPHRFWEQSYRSCEIYDINCAISMKTTYFECIICAETKVLVDNLCLNACPYGFTAIPSCISSSSIIIDENFNDNFQGTYGILQTSSSAFNYQFFMEPELDDPVPSYARGLYFSGSQYLKTSIDIYLNYQFSIGLWIYKTNDGGIFQKEERIWLRSDGNACVILESPRQTTTTLCTDALYFSEWSYLSLVMSYELEPVSITMYLNNYWQNAKTTWGSLFRDPTSDIMYLGKNDESGFNGFIYHFSLWNSAITDFSPKLSIPCGSILSTSCLWSCDISHYYDGNSCQKCFPCALGCTRAASCNICYDPLCSTCSGFGPGLCTQCVNNASGGGLTSCSCNSGFSVAADGFSCVSGCATGCASCSGPDYLQCTSCLAMYYYGVELCIPVCPTGYKTDYVNRKCILESTEAFSLQLQNLIQLDKINQVQVGYSSKNNYPEFDEFDPIPSLGRGYFFNSKSYMSSTNLIINTFFSITIWLKPISSGNVMLKVNGSFEMFKISISDQEVLSLKLILQNLSILLLSEYSNLFNGWHNIAFKSETSNSQMLIYLYIDSIFKRTEGAATPSPFIDLGNLKLGGSVWNNGFTGFLWSLKIFNLNNNYLDEWKTNGCAGGCSSCPSELICLNNCNFGFYDSNGCNSCDSSCNGCRNSSTCSLCSQSRCFRCTKFDGPCTACYPKATLIDGECICDKKYSVWKESTHVCEICDTLCAQCAGDYYFWCSICNEGEVLVGNVCLHACPYGFRDGCTVENNIVISNSFINQDFAGSYGIFTTGENPSSYHFFNNPEEDDPVPLKNRGLYFSNGQYLKSNVEVYLSHSFSLGFWFNSYSYGDVFAKQNRLSIDSKGSVMISLEDQWAILYTFQLSENKLELIYYSLTVSYWQGSTTITIYINGIQGPSKTFFNYIFRDAVSQAILIGRSELSSFTGMIYNFQLWNSPIYNFDLILNEVCGEGLGLSCLWGCNIDFYQDSPDLYKKCINCPFGCVRETSCNICDDKLCAICAGFGPGLCLSCVVHASGSVCKCDEGYYLSLDGYSCVLPCAAGYLPDLNSICLESSLENCTIVEDHDGNHCNKCDTGYFLDVDSTCVPILAHCHRELDGVCQQCNDGYIYRHIKNGRDRSHHTLETIDIV